MTTLWIIAAQVIALAVVLPILAVGKRGDDNI